MQFLFLMLLFFGNISKSNGLEASAINNVWYGRLCGCGKRQRENKLSILFYLRSFCLLARAITLDVTVYREKLLVHVSLFRKHWCIERTFCTNIPEKKTALDAATVEPIHSFYAKNTCWRVLASFTTVYFKSCCCLLKLQWTYLLAFNNFSFERRFPTA